MKTLDPAVVAVLNGTGTKMPAWLLEFDFVDELGNPAQACFTMPGGIEIEWGGKTYYPTGALGMSDVTSQTQLVANNLTMQLSGVTPQNVANVLRSEFVGKPFRMYFAILGPDYIPLGTPTLEYEGTMDAPTLTDTPTADGLSSVVAIPVESEIVDYARPKTRRQTDADQQAEFPGDRFYDQIGNVPDRATVWPAAAWFRT